MLPKALQMMPAHGRLPEAAARQQNPRYLPAHVHDGKPVDFESATLLIYSHFIETLP